ncbi:MAG: K(+)-transporting ATPase subunit F [Ilumatobacteraceae bacterium]
MIAAASDNLVGLILAVLALGYLLCVLAFPERF